MTALPPAEVARLVAHGKHQQPETAILRVVAGYLRATGWFVVRMQQGLGCHKGVADLVAMKGGRTIWVEIKTPKGRLSDWQDGFRQAVANSGCEYIVARCMEDVVDL